MIGNNENVRNS